MLCVTSSTSGKNGCEGATCLFIVYISGDYTVDTQRRKPFDQQAAANIIRCFFCDRAASNPTWGYLQQWTLTWINRLQPDNPPHTQHPNRTLIVAHCCWGNPLGWNRTMVEEGRMLVLPVSVCVSDLMCNCVTARSKGHMFSVLSHWWSTTKYVQWK